MNFILYINKNNEFVKVSCSLQFPQHKGLIRQHTKPNYRRKISPIQKEKKGKKKKIQPWLCSTQA